MKGIQVAQPLSLLRYFTVIFLFNSSVNAQSFGINLKINTANDFIHIAFADYAMAGQRFRDTIIFNNGEAVLRKALPQPVLLELSCNVRSIPHQVLFLAGQQQNITIDGRIRYEDTPLQQGFEQLTGNDRIREGYYSLYATLRTQNDTIGLKRLSAVFDSLNINDTQRSLAFVKENAGSPLVLFAFTRYTTFLGDFIEAETMFQTLPDWAKHSPDGMLFQSKYQGKVSTWIGSPAPDFVQLSANGDTVRLVDFRNKYVLLDFWASWCGPCRKGNPELVKIHDKYRSDNFEIISISLDNNRTSWIAAIAKDSLNWTNISDLQGFNNKLATAYGIEAIPANLLVDPDGKISAKNLSTAELASLLKNIFGK